MGRDPTLFSGDDLSLLYRIAQTLLNEGEYGELLAALLDASIEGFGADRGFVVVREAGHERRRFRAVVARNYKSDALTKAEEEVSSSISAAVVEQGQALLVGDALDSGRFRENPSVKRLGLRSVLCAPLVASNEAFALIYLENRDIANRFTDHHRQLLDEICRLAAPRLRAAVAVEDARKRAQQLETSLGESDGIVTADAAMGAVLKTLRQVARTDLPVLVQGETGTGKELVARAIYRRSSRGQGPFMVINCAAIPHGLIESELFGYVRAAFTGAYRDHIGLIGAANRGTVFLDEVGDLPLELQSRLLRVLQSGEYRPLGSTRPETADVRVIAATNRDLEREVEEGRFRSDLYYRLSSIILKIPPLRERPHDVHLLTDHFLRGFATRFGREAPRLSDECLAALATYAFPGNVRELENELARLVAVSPPGAVLGPETLNERIVKPAGSSASAGSRPAAPSASSPLPPMPLAEMEEQLIVSVLAHTCGNRTRAAEILGISREGLRTKMQRLGISDGS